MAFERAASVEDVWPGEMTAVTVGGASVVLVNAGGCIRAYDDHCAHQRFPISRGRLQGAVVTCALHGWTYDALTGQGLNPRAACLRSFPVLVEAGEVLVDPAGEGAA